MTLPGMTPPQVDYFTHDFDLFDLHSSWKNATRHKNQIANGRRLENASWRKFFQLKNKLTTIHPEELNWNKDMDTCWLYGPFHTYEPLPVLQAKYATEPVSGLKPVLKKRCEQDDFLQLLRDAYVESRAGNPSDAIQSLQQRTAAGAVKYTKFTGSRPLFYFNNSKSLPQIYKNGKRRENLSQECVPLAMETKRSSSKNIRFNQKVEQRLIVDPNEVLDIDSQTTMRVKLSITHDDDSDSDEDDCQKVSLHVLPKGVSKAVWEKSPRRSMSPKFDTSNSSTGPSTSMVHLPDTTLLASDDNLPEASIEPPPISINNINSSIGPSSPNSIPVPSPRSPPGISSAKQLDEYYSNLYADAQDEEDDEALDSVVQRILEVATNAVELSGWVAKSAFSSVIGGL